MKVKVFQHAWARFGSVFVRILYDVTAHRYGSGFSAERTDEQMMRWFEIICFTISTQTCWKISTFKNKTDSLLFSGAEMKSIQFLYRWKTLWFWIQATPQPQSMLLCLLINVQSDKYTPSRNIPAMGSNNCGVLCYAPHKEHVPCHIQYEPPSPPPQKRVYMHVITHCYHFRPPCAKRINIARILAQRVHVIKYVCVYVCTKCKSVVCSYYIVHSCMLHVCLYPISTMWSPHASHESLQLRGRLRNTDDGVASYTSSLL